MFGLLFPLVIEPLGKFVQAPVLVHLGVGEVLVTRGEFAVQQFLQVLEYLHYDKEPSVWVPKGP